MPGKAPRLFARGSCGITVRLRGDPALRNRRRKSAYNEESLPWRQGSRQSGKPAGLYAAKLIAGTVFSKKNDSSGEAMKIHRERVKFKKKFANRKFNVRWIVGISIITFLIAIVLGYFSLVFMEIVSLPGAVAILLFIIFIGVFFDLLGIAVTAASETPFHSMAASRVRGAAESILLVRNASSVANFFNDVIGDISGIISGSAAAAIVIKLNQNPDAESTLASILITAGTAALTVGGKAVGKELAMRHASYIVYSIGRLVSLLPYDLKKSKKRKRNKNGEAPGTDRRTKRPEKTQ